MSESDPVTTQRGIPTAKPWYDPATSVVALRALDSSLRGSVFVVEPGTSIVGRELDCDHSVGHPTISRKHCTLLLNDQDFEIRDNQSTHGVSVNGERCSAAKLRPGDLVKLGSVNFIVETRRKPNARPTPKVERKGGPALRIDNMIDVALDQARSDVTYIPKARDNEVTRSLPVPGRIDFDTQYVTLRVASADGNGDFYCLRPGLNMIGRQEGNEFEINHPTLSRHHCVVALDQERILVADCQSLHGIRVNGKRVLESEVRLRDVLQLGDIMLVVEAYKKEALEPLLRFKKLEAEEAEQAAPPDRPKRQVDVPTRKMLKYPSPPARRGPPPPVSIPASIQAVAVG